MTLATRGEATAPWRAFSARSRARAPASSRARPALPAHPDVILVDIFLGEESGLDLTRHLAEDGLSDKATVILISTHAEANLGDLIAASPAAGFVPKAELSAKAISRIVDGSSG